MNDHFTEMLLTLTDAGVKYVVAGGVAAVLYGVERVTLDLDIAVEMSNDNLERVLSAIEQMGMRPRAPVPLDVLLDPVKRDAMVQKKQAMVFSLIDQRDLLRQIDIFLNEDLSYHHLVKECETITVQGRDINIIGRHRLLQLKKAIQPPRPKDRLDIEELEQMIKEGSP